MPLCVEWKAENTKWQMNDKKVFFKRQRAKFSLEIYRKKSVQMAKCTCYQKLNDFFFTDFAWNGFFTLFRWNEHKNIEKILRWLKSFFPLIFRWLPKYLLTQKNVKIECEQSVELSLGVLNMFNEILQCNIILSTW